MTPIKLEKDPQGGYLVTQGNLDSGCLAPDEALGIIAHALYGDGSPHRFLKPWADTLPNLLPCSHCGNLDSVILSTDEESSFTQVICSAKASGCGSSGGFKSSIVQAIELWNSRVTA